MTFEEFTQQFTDENIPYEEVEGTLYSPGEALDVAAPLKYKTTRLGTQNRQGFKPSIALLDILGKTSTKKTMVNEKTAWLFVCGKNVLKEGIVSRGNEEGLTLITNEKDEVLGYGKITGAGVTNLLDRGDFLRREK